MGFPNTKDREVITENDDGSYTIFINAKISHDAQLRAYQHAMRHINEDDFKKYSVQAIEAQAHELTIPEDSERIPSAEFEKRIQALRKERAKIQRKMRAYEEKVAFLRAYYKPEYFFDKLEEQYLYGDDL